ncbi:peptidoglycan-binding domain-containing protein [Streptomyces sp. NPDC005283]|uniref:peptidoglycan-binding domain-containing protein n=1 Tax=Streptomyces sp. NPDC005283 TaxID=3156871 RepID=UPI003453AF73
MTEVHARPQAHTDTVTGADDHAPRPRRSRVLLVSIAVVLAAGTVAAVVLRDRPGDEPPARLSETATTTPVTRGDLAATDKLDGTLEYADEVYLPNRLTGTVTWVVRPGETVSRGGVLYRVDEKPVVLLYGKIPAYRAFGQGMSDGGDVRQLESNLAALGYTGFTVDEEFTDNTADAVKRWQRDLGLPKTGQLELGRVLFAPQSVRAGAADRKPGDETQSGSPVLATTKAERAVTVKAKLSQQQLLPVGKRVLVTLPGRDKPVAGKVTSVGTVVGGGGGDDDKNKGGGGGGDDDKNKGGGGKNPEGGDQTVVVKIALLDQKAAGTLTYAPVRIEVESERRRGVLSVPVAALLALREGGYGVQVVKGDTTRIIPVTTGMFSGGRVEVSGTGITEGLKVGMPAL